MRVPKSVVPKMPTPPSVTVILPVAVLVTLGACRPKLPLPPLMPAVTLPEFRIEPVPATAMPAPPSPTVTTPLLVTTGAAMGENAGGRGAAGDNARAGDLVIDAGNDAGHEVTDRNGAEI